MADLILGSSASSRRRVMQAAGVAFLVMPPNIDEKLFRSDDPFNLPVVVANAKADAILSRLFSENKLVITADQIVLGPGGEPREKPETDKEVDSFVRSYAGESARTVSCVVVTSAKTGARAVGVHVQKVQFGPGLANDGNVERVLQPGQPVPLPILFERVVCAPQDVADEAATLAYGSQPSHGRDIGSDPQRLVDVRDSAGGLCIEHPFVAPHVLRIQTESCSVACPDCCGLDSVHGLPWIMTRALIRQVDPTHPLAL